MVSAGTADNSGPFTITASTFTVTNLRIDQTAIQQGGSLADAVTVDVVATDLVISKQVLLPGVGPTTFSTAATSNEPARLYGLRAHIVAIASAQGNFSNLGDILASNQQSPATATSPGSATPVATTATATSGIVVQPTPTIMPTPVESEVEQAEATTTPAATQSPASSGGNTPPGGSTTGNPALPRNLSTLTLTFTNVQIQATFLVVQAATLPNVIISVH